MDAAEYDEFVTYATRPPETGAEMRRLAELAAGGKVLELGVGTGRVAIPLARTGLEVHGIERDPAMAAELGGKLGGEGVVVHLGDMAEVNVEGTFDLVYAVFGTLFALPRTTRSAASPTSPPICRRQASSSSRPLCRSPARTSTARK